MRFQVREVKETGNAKAGSYFKTGSSVILSGAKDLNPLKR